MCRAVSSPWGEIGACKWQSTDFREAKDPEDPKDQNRACQEHALNLVVNGENSPGQGVRQACSQIDGAVLSTPR